MNFRINNKIINDPLGEECDKFGMLSFNVYSSYNLFEVINKCFKNQKIYIKSYFDSGIASSQVNLTNAEKKKGLHVSTLVQKLQKLLFLLKRRSYTQR